MPDSGRAREQSKVMAHPSETVGRFCWLDLAATDADRASVFYREMFGWTSDDQLANGGVFTRLLLSGNDVGSLYQMKREHIDQGARSHWTPYVRVRDVNSAASRAATAGGTLLVRPFTVSGVATIALIRDTVGATLGLWQQPAADERKSVDA
jgi:predicted enzyme related to lactoylglutathione lyase